MHYKDIGCTPIVKEGEECASSYNCDHLQTLNTTGCYYRGRYYSDREHASPLPNCVPYGLCIENGGFFMAGHVDCVFDFRILVEECVVIHRRHKRCCPETICGKEKIAQVLTCYADGEKHFKGEQWTAKGDNCIECTCDEHFDNSTSIYENKNCKTRECFEDFWRLDKYRKGCGPVFHDHDRCCPVSSKCRKCLLFMWRYRTFTTRLAHLGMFCFSTYKYSIVYNLASHIIIWWCSFNESICKPSLNLGLKKKSNWNLKLLSYKMLVLRFASIATTTTILQLLPLPFCNPFSIGEWPADKGQDCVEFWFEMQIRQTWAWYWRRCQTRGKQLLGLSVLDPSPYRMPMERQLHKDFKRWIVIWMEWKP